MQRKIGALIFIFIVGILIAQCSQKQDLTDMPVVSISIAKDNTITLNGNTILLENLSEKLKSLDQNAVVKISADSSVKMGVIQEVHKQIRDAHLSNIKNVSKE